MISLRDLFKIIFLAAILFVISLGARFFAEREGLRFHTSILSFPQARADAPPACGEGSAEGSAEGGGGGGEGCGSSCADGSSGCGGSCW